MSALIPAAYLEAEGLPHRPAAQPAPGAGAAAVGLPAEVAGELKAPAPGGRYTFARSWLPGESGHLHTGRQVDDPHALEGKALEVVPGTDAVTDTTVYGPYIDMAPGYYVAFWRLIGPAKPTS